MDLKKEEADKGSNPTSNGHDLGERGYLTNVLVALFC